MVIVSVEAFVVSVMFDPATSVSVSGAASATTSDCPATAIVPNACVDPPPPAAMVTVSVEALVVIVILAPAARVNVSGAASATTFDCPATAMLPNAIVDPPPPPVPAMSLMSFGEKLRSAVTVPGTVFSAGSTWRGNRRAAVV